MTEEAGRVSIQMRDTWKKALTDLEADCPWAGPRPLTLERDDKARYRFTERRDETKRFLDVVRSNRLVVLHGESGAGKSSLLEMALIDALNANGLAALTCRDWSRLGERPPADFLAEEFRRLDLLHPTVIEKIAKGRGLVDVLDDLYDGDAVIILDQFEELIRNRRPKDFDRMTNWILEVNKAHRTKVVISLRSEYQHRLASLIRAARPFSTAHMELPVLLDGEEIRKVVESANLRAVGLAIETEAVNTLMERWTALAAGGRPYNLLAVQASLYSLYHLARRRMTGSQSPAAVVVSVEDVVTLQDDADAAAWNTPGHVDLFTHSFDVAIDVRLENCTKACDGLGLPEWFVNNTRSCVVDAAEHLSSGDLKLEREVGDLLVRSKDREFRLTRWSRDDAKDAVVELLKQREGFDYLACNRGALAHLMRLPAQEPRPNGEDGREGLAEQGVFPVPWLDDPRDVSSGPMLAYPVGELLLEQVRAYAFALDWLEASYLVRMTSSDEAMSVSLVHDGFGPPLEAWASRRGLDTRAAASSVVAYEGRRFDWADAPDLPPFRNQIETPHYLVNLRWRNCRVDRATFEHVVFVNCDFRGVSFDHCVFEGVTFVNCLLDSASFEWCTFVGASDVGFEFELSARDPGYEQATARAEQDARRQVSDMPDFVLADGVEQVVRDLNWFRRPFSDEDADCLYSPTSGVAAVAWSSGRGSGVPWVRQTAGLAMYGGRLSSLMIKDCMFLPGADGRPASISLCFMAGSSLDFVEQGSGRVNLFYSTVRGLAVTNRVDAQQREPEASFHLRAHECVLANTFFGEGLRGAASLRSSKVLGITSASDESFPVTVEDSRVTGGDNVVFSDTVNPLEGFGTGGMNVEAQTVLAEETRKLAYRSVPARLEAEARIRAGR